MFDHKCMITQLRKCWLDIHIDSGENKKLKILKTKNTFLLKGMIICRMSSLRGDLYTAVRRARLLLREE